jgi:hypothetical protein
VQLQTLVDLVPRFGKQASSVAIPPPDLLIVYLVCPFFSYALVFVKPSPVNACFAAGIFLLERGRVPGVKPVQQAIPQAPGQTGFHKGVDTSPL